MDRILWPVSFFLILVFVLLVFDFLKYKSQKKYMTNDERFEPNEPEIKEQEPGISNDPMADLISIPGYPYRILRSVDEQYIMDSYQRILAEGKKKGFIPVLVYHQHDNDNMFSNLRRRFEENKKTYSVKKILSEEILAEDGKAFLDASIKEIMEMHTNFTDDPGSEAGEPNPNTGYAIGKNVILFEAPVTKPWEIMAYIPLLFDCQWNETHGVKRMLQICRYFYEQYSAVPVVITENSLQMSVPEAIVPEKAFDVALEHYAFSDEICSSTNIKTEALNLAQETIWYFRWN